MIHGFHAVGFLPKPFAKEIETEIVKSLVNIDEVDLELLQLAIQVFCRTRCGSRDLHKLLETIVLSKIDEIKK